MTPLDRADGPDAEPVTPPLPKVDLPEINRAPVVDRSSAAYLASTPGLEDAGAEADGEATLPSPFPAPTEPAESAEPGASGTATPSPAPTGDEATPRRVWPWIFAPLALAIAGVAAWLIATGAFG